MTGMFSQSQGLHEECGVFGIWGVPQAASLVYYGLHSLQHRGQEGCGIVAVNDAGQLRRVKGEGLVTEVFNEEKVASRYRECPAFPFPSQHRGFRSCP